MNLPLLSLVTFVPLVGAAAILAMPQANNARWIALGTTIVTFLMVFLIQSTQNRDSEAVQVKLDELIRAIEGAHNALLDLEELEEDELDQIRDKYAKLAQEAREKLQADEAQPPVDKPAADVRRL